jgi:tetrahydromethanopterin:alpha-L-glutamate ligase
MEPPDVLILGGRPEGWHGSRLLAAFAQLGAVARHGDLAALTLAVGADGVGRVAGLPGRPRAVLVRSVPAGTFEQVTLRLGLLHALEALGVPVTNPARVIERCVDKSMTSFLLARRGVPTPPTWAVQSAEAAAARCAAEAANGRPLVLKPLFGAQGRGLRLVRGAGDLPPAEEVGGVYYLQRFVGHERDGWHDYRVLVVAGRAVAAMRRRGAGWVTNIGRGGIAEPVAATGQLAQLARSAAAAVGADHAGVDLIEDGARGLVVLEVNSMPAWQGLQAVSAANVALALAQDALARAGSRDRAPA